MIEFCVAIEYYGNDGAISGMEVNFHYVFRDIAGTAGNIHVKVKMTMDKGVRTCGI